MFEDHLPNAGAVMVDYGETPVATLPRRGPPATPPAAVGPGGGLDATLRAPQTPLHRACVAGMP